MDAQVRARVVSNVDDETFEAFRDTVRRYVRERLVPLEMTVEADDEVPSAIVGELKEMGLFGFTIPADYGGIGLSASQEMELAKELGWTSPAFRGIIGTTIGIGIRTFFGWAVLRTLEDQGFNTLIVPGTRLAVIAVSGAAAGAVTATLPARRAARLQVLDALAAT